MPVCVDTCCSVWLFVFVNVYLWVACVRAVGFSCKCVPRLLGQVTHRGDPFSASPHPRPQTLCLLQMCPRCLVPYPIILCPCSKSPCLPIVLLTCSTMPIVRNPPLLSAFISGQLLFFFLVDLFLWFAPLTSLFAFSLSIDPHSFPPSFTLHIFFIFCELNFIFLQSCSPVSCLYLFPSPP